MLRDRPQVRRTPRRHEIADQKGRRSISVALARPDEHGGIYTSPFGHDCL